MVKQTTGSNTFVDKSCLLQSPKSHPVGELLCMCPPDLLAAALHVVPVCWSEEGRCRRSDCQPLEAGDGSAHSASSSVLFLEPRWACYVVPVPGVQCDWPFVCMAT